MGFKFVNQETTKSGGCGKKLENKKGKGVAEKPPQYAMKDLPFSLFRNYTYTCHFIIILSRPPKILKLHQMLLFLTISKIGKKSKRKLKRYFALVKHSSSKFF